MKVFSRLSLLFTMGFTMEINDNVLTTNLRGASFIETRRKHNKMRLQLEEGKETEENKTEKQKGETKDEKQKEETEKEPENKPENKPEKETEDKTKENSSEEDSKPKNKVQGTWFVSENEREVYIKLTEVQYKMIENDLKDKFATDPKNSDSAKPNPRSDAVSKAWENRLGAVVIRYTNDDRATQVDPYIIDTGTYAKAIMKLDPSKVQAIQDPYGRDENEGDGAAVPNRDSNQGLVDTTPTTLEYDTIPYNECIDTQIDDLIYVLGMGWTELLGFEKLRSLKVEILKYNRAFLQKSIVHRTNQDSNEGISEKIFRTVCSILSLASGLPSHLKKCGNVCWWPTFWRKWVNALLTKFGMDWGNTPKPKELSDIEGPEEQFLSEEARLFLLETLNGYNPGRSATSPMSVNPAPAEAKEEPKAISKSFTQLQTQLFSGDTNKSAGGGKLSEKDLEGWIPTDFERRNALVVSKQVVAVLNKCKWYEESIATTADVKDIIAEVYRRRHGYCYLFRGIVWLFYYFPRDRILYGIPRWFRNTFREILYWLVSAQWLTDLLNLMTTSLAASPPVYKAAWWLGVLVFTACCPWGQILQMVQGWLGGNNNNNNNNNNGNGNGNNNNNQQSLISSIMLGSGGGGLLGGGGGGLMGGGGGGGLIGALIGS